jgi:cellulose synthase/poly-beta-1,6-N-acetylglucosamine synthase-like glycosyltransferase
MSDPAVGGVQVKVRIYNRDHPLTWCQDVEFSIYGLLYQAGRSTEGIAGMGGNGQFNRLSALRSVDEGSGPWHPTLTEDQDLGIRLLLNGWRSEHDNGCDVSQQGVRNIKRLWTQRTRWSQGNLQAMTYLGRVTRGPLRWWRCFDLLGVLVLPIVQGIVGVSLGCSIWFAVVKGYRVVPASPVLIAAFLVLGMGSTVIGCVARCGGSWRGVLRSVPVAVAYVAYTWMMWPVLIRSTLRVLLRRGSWAKTEREIVPDEGEPADATAVSRDV